MTRITESAIELLEKQDYQCIDAITNKPYRSKQA